MYPKNFIQFVSHSNCVLKDLEETLLLQGETTSCSQQNFHCVEEKVLPLIITLTIRRFLLGKNHVIAP